MSKHTPGPWSVWTSNSYRRIGSDKTGDHVIVPIIQHHDNHPDLHFPNGGFSGPDARLIAAAPELLEALQGVVRMIKWAKENEDSPKSALSHFISSEPVFAAAITKATGA